MDGQPWTLDISGKLFKSPLQTPDMNAKLNRVTDYDEGRIGELWNNQKKHKYYTYLLL
jgi:hypothetical protein